MSLKSFSDSWSFMFWNDGVYYVERMYFFRRSSDIITCCKSSWCSCFDLSLFANPGLNDSTHILQRFQFYCFTKSIDAVIA